MVRYNNTSNMVAYTYDHRREQIMRRLCCPWCNQWVNLNSADLIKSVNGRGLFKTEIYAHRSCYEKWKENNKHEAEKAVKNDQ